MVDHWSSNLEVVGSTKATEFFQCLGFSVLQVIVYLILPDDDSDMGEKS